MSRPHKSSVTNACARRASPSQPAGPSTNSPANYVVFRKWAQEGEEISPIAQMTSASSAALGDRLVDVCPEFRRALAAFRKSAANGDTESAAKHWQRVDESARAYRRRMTNGEAGR